MVYILPPAAKPDTLKAFITANLDSESLQHFKQTFAKAANLSFAPLLHLKIIQAPASYLSATHSFNRSLEDVAGNTDPFIIIDKNFANKGAVWYIDQFADESDVECGFAVSEKVVMKALVLVEYLAMGHVCWREGNPPMGEELEALEQEGLLPLREESVQEEPLGQDADGDLLEAFRELQVIAEPGEFETTTEKKVLENMGLEDGEEAIRLRADVAKRENLTSVWTHGESVEEYEMEDGSTKNFPKGSVCLQVRYDPQVPRLQYEWPEGSL
ncbi:hypothetical protein E4T42_09206 [Aureobasidium subglaciale]|nr:hypothetical protein E4T42_09206 [Aureobasidium subglaciale]